MILRDLFVVATLTLLSGCGTMKYTPMEYPLRDGLIPALSVNGDVKINNVQASTDQAIVHSYGGNKLASNYKEITQLMVEQTIKEINKNGNHINSNNQKTINIKVNYLISNYIAFHWRSELKYTATLGNGETIDKTVTHGSASVIQDLNGCIAESVMDLLNDKTVIAYLAR